MESIILKVLLTIYFLLLFSLFICDLYYGISKYLQNKDVSQIDFKPFNQDDNGRYPTLTMCFGGPFLSDKFEKYGKPGINETLYTAFLKGEHWNEVMVNIPYDDVSLNITDHVNSVSLYGENWKGVLYVSFRSALMKCFSVDIPSPKLFPLNDSTVKYLRISMNSTVFRNGTRPKGNSGPLNKDSFGIQLHFPGQRMRAASPRGND